MAAHVGTAEARCCACRCEIPGGYRNSKNRRCEECKRAYDSAYFQKNKDRLTAQNRAWAEAHPERMAAISAASYERDKANGKRHARNLAVRGLTVAQYEALLEAQAGVCAICGGTDNRRLNVDHDHATGEIRGLLCSGCNGAKLGRLGHSIERIEARAELLERRARDHRRAAEYLREPPARKVIRG